MPHMLEEYLASLPDHPTPAELTTELRRRVELYWAGRAGGYQPSDETTAVHILLAESLALILSLQEELGEDEPDDTPVDDGVGGGGW